MYNSYILIFFLISLRRMWQATIPQMTPITNMITASAMIERHSQERIHWAGLANSSTESDIRDGCLITTRQCGLTPCPVQADLRGSVPKTLI